MNKKIQAAAARTTTKTKTKTKKRNAAGNVNKLPDPKDYEDNKVLIF